MDRRTFNGLHYRSTPQGFSQCYLFTCFYSEYTDTHRYFEPQCSIHKNLLLNKRWKLHSQVSNSLLKQNLFFSLRCKIDLLSTFLSFSWSSFFLDTWTHGTPPTTTTTISLTHTHGLVPAFYRWTGRCFLFDGAGVGSVYVWGWCWKGLYGSGCMFKEHWIRLMACSQV